MRQKRWPKRSRSSDNTGADELIADSQNVRNELLTTAQRLSEFTQSLNAEIGRLKTLAQRMDDNGQ
jgi:hypothetical protein